MILVLYEDKDIIVVEKPVGMESQVSRGFSADMVSEIKRHIHNLSPGNGEPYVGVIHRLDKPVGGIMVYAKNQKAAAALSKDVQDGIMRKMYFAVVCGKLVDKQGQFVDYLLKDSRTNCSKIVDKGTTCGKLAKSDYYVVGSTDDGNGIKTLVEVNLLTGRHHQIRVQFAGHGLPLYGDNRYNPEFQNSRNTDVALFAWKLQFRHPQSKKIMDFEKLPTAGIFSKFQDILIEYKRSTKQK